jgi:hypothetical protein
VHPLVPNGQRVHAVDLGSEHDLVMEVLQIHDVTQLRSAVWVLDTGLHVEGVCS